MANQLSNRKQPKLVINPLIRWLLLCCGWTALGCGIAGIFLPLVPTVPLLLLAAACFMRSSERLHCWLLEHPRLAPLIVDYLHGKGIPPRAKRMAIGTLWISVSISAVFFVSVAWIRILLLVVAIGVTSYLASLPVRTEGAAQNQVSSHD